RTARARSVTPTSAYGFGAYVISVSPDPLAAVGLRLYGSERAHVRARARLASLLLCCVCGNRSLPYRLQFGLDVEDDFVMSALRRPARDVWRECLNDFACPADFAERRLKRAKGRRAGTERRAQRTGRNP